jgi:hypothetical protein
MLFDDQIARPLERRDSVAVGEALDHTELEAFALRLVGPFPFGCMVQIVGKDTAVVHPGDLRLANTCSCYCIWEVLEEEPLVDTDLAARLQNRTLEPPHALEPYEPALGLVQLGLFVYSVPPLAAVAEFLGLVTC